MLLNAHRKIFATMMSLGPSPPLSRYASLLLEPLAAPDLAMFITPT